MTVLVSGDSFLDDGVVSEYDMVKDVSWPNIQSAFEFTQLPTWIKDECETVFNITPNANSFLNIFGHDYINMARAGAGNEYISHTVIDTCMRNNNITNVFVLWSGMNRISNRYGVNVSKSINPSLQLNTTLGNSNWIHTGGTYGSHTLESKKSILYQYNSIQHKEYDTRYFTDMTIFNIETTASFLKQRNIKYTFGFIYNPHINYSIDLNPNIINEGMFNHDSNMYRQYNWANYLTTFPYNWGIENNVMHDDMFHLTDDGMLQWFNQIKDDITCI